MSIAHSERERAGVTSSWGHLAHLCGLRGLAQVAVAAWLCAACQPRPAPPKPDTPAQGPAAAQLPAAASPVAAAGLASDGSPTAAAALPGSATSSGSSDLSGDPSPTAGAPVKPAKRKLEVKVFDFPSDDPEAKLLLGYERLGKRKNLEIIEINTDRNAVEFPASNTTAKIRGAPVPRGEGAGRAQALRLDFHLEDQRADFAGCSGGNTCGCENVEPYAYISLSQNLSSDTHIEQSPFLSFWAKSAETFHLHIILACYVEPRPMGTVPPFDGYLDEELTQINPCWHSPHAELPLSDPIEILGDGQWHRYVVRTDDLPPGEPVTMSGGGQMVCSRDKVAQIVYALKKNHPPQPGEYPKASGVVYFDDLQALQTP